MTNYIKATALFFSIVFVCAYKPTSAQDLNDNAEYKKFNLTYAGLAEMTSDDLQLDPLMVNLKPSPKSEDQDEVFEAYKLKLNQQRRAQAELQNNNAIKYRANEPSIIKTFNGTPNSGTPPDHAIAVNTQGQVMTIVNSTMRIYDSNGVLKLSRVLATFFNQSNLHGVINTMNMCDPKVYFDCPRKRYILFGMNCDGDSDSSQIIIGFSTDENAMSPWHVYTYKADQFNLNYWFDYPKMGISQKELFVSGNMFNNNGSYKDGYLFQIDKEAAYTGATTVNALCWKGFTGTNKFTLLPISHGYCTDYGDKMYVTSTSGGGFSPSNTISLYEINGLLNANPTRTVTNISVTPSYTSPADAEQQNTSVLLSTGDSRAQDGIYIDGNIHMVFHYNAGSGYSGIYYAKLFKNGNGSWVSSNKTIKNVNVEDYAYPAICSWGTSNTDQSTLITFANSGTSYFPGYSIIASDATGNLSNVVSVIKGTDYVDLITSANGVTRWGDYSSISRAFNFTHPTAWSFAGYGNLNKGWTNYVAKISAAAPAAQSNLQVAQNSSIFPNPAPQKRWHMTIPYHQFEAVDFLLYDVNGKLVKNLYKGYLNNGENEFSFNEAGLTAGAYILKVQGVSKLIAVQKLVIE